MTGSRGPAARAEPGAWGGVLRSGGTRLLVLPLTAVIGVVITRLIVDHYGSAAYAQYGLLVGIGALLPFTDLGMSAAVINAIAAAPDPARSEQVRRTLLTALRLLLVSGLGLAAVAVVIGALDGWPRLLGSGLDRHGGPVATACLLLIALGVPVGIGQRMLIGLGRNHVAVLVLGLQSPIVLVVLIAMIASGAGHGSLFPAVPYAASVLLAVACTRLAAGRLRPAFRDAVRQVPAIRRHRGTRVFDVAWPMLVQMIAVPLAMQSDRLVLSHLRGPGMLAQYNLAAQMFLPIWAVVNSAGYALWPVFARARSEGRRSSPFPMAGAFAGLAALAALLVGLASPWLAELATGGKIALPLGLAAWFGVLMVLQAAKFPLGQFLTDARGLRYQAVMITFMLPVNLVLSLWLTGPLGVVGPLVGSVVGVGLFEFAANAWYAGRRMRHEERSPSVPGVPGPAAASAQEGTMLP